jgi:hypothetical protein
MLEEKVLMTISQRAGQFRRKLRRKKQSKLRTLRGSLHLAMDTILIHHRQDHHLTNIGSLIHIPHIIMPQDTLLRREITFLTFAQCSDLEKMLDNRNASKDELVQAGCKASQAKRLLNKAVEFIESHESAQE